jgi:hypothetical protein
MPAQGAGECQNSVNAQNDAPEDEALAGRSPAKCTRAGGFIEEWRRMPIQLRIIVPAITSIDLEEGA